MGSLGRLLQGEMNPGDVGSVRRAKSAHEVFEDVLVAVELEEDAFVEVLGGFVGDLLVEDEDVEGTFLEAWAVLLVAVVGDALETLDVCWYHCQFVALWECFSK